MIFNNGIIKHSEMLEKQAKNLKIMLSNTKVIDKVFYARLRSPVLLLTGTGKWDVYCIKL